ncbi:MAG: hypothetical protein K2X35_10215 [Bryobacteraceae bacterium]|nr:hypothetical protein [Bryobacteraceae bacterium]
MRITLVASVGFLLALGVVLAQSPPQQANQKKQQPAPRVVPSGDGYVGVDPKQPYRPIPLNQIEPRESIFGFYLRVLNPRQIRWGDEFDRRFAVLSEQSVENPYFRLCAFQLALIVILLTTCWLWWDKLRQVKWVAAESLADAINARTLTELRAREAIATHNRHMEMCNRVVDGLPTLNTEGGQTLDELLSDLAASKTEVARLTAKLTDRETESAKIEARLRQLEDDLQHRTAESPNAELAARLARAEGQLAAKSKRNGS